MRGFKGGKVIPNSNSLEVHDKSELTQQLESTFSNVPLSVPSAAIESDEILDIGMIYCLMQAFYIALSHVCLCYCIDDIDIDETPVASTSSNIHEHRRGNLHPLLYSISIGMSICDLVFFR